MPIKDAVEIQNKTIRLKLHVIPGSKSPCFPAGIDEWRHALEMKVQAAPKDNKANEEVLQILADFLHISQRNITLASGHKGREKVVIITGITPKVVYQKLEEGLP